MNYSYPCLFHKEKDNSYTLTFVDLACGFICASNKNEAIDAAIDTLYDVIEDEEEFPKNLLPKPTKKEDIDLLKYNKLYFSDDNIDNLTVEIISVDD